LASKRDIPRLIECLKDRRPEVQQEAGEALGEIGEDAVAPLMLAAPDVGEPAEITLSAIGEPAVGPVIDAIRDGNTHLVHTLGLLANLKRPRAFPALCDVAIKHGSRAARDHARTFIDAILGNGELIILNGNDVTMRHPVLRAATADEVGQLASDLITNAALREFLLASALDLHEDLPAPPGLWERMEFPLWVAANRVASGLVQGLSDFSRKRGYEVDDVMAAVVDDFEDGPRRWQMSGAEDWCRLGLGLPPVAAGVEGVEIPAYDDDAVTLMRKLMAAKVAKA